jgi:hypothetical protein
MISFVEKFGVQSLQTSRVKDRGRLSGFNRETLYVAGTAKGWSWLVILEEGGYGRVFCVFKFVVGG